MALAQSTKASRVANSPSYQDRVKVYMSDIAIDVMAELASVPNHTERVAYAQTVLNGTASVLEYAHATMSNPTVFSAADLDAENQGIIDNDLGFAATSIVNAMAGVHNI